MKMIIGPVPSKFNTKILNNEYVENSRINGRSRFEKLSQKSIATDSFIATLSKIDPNYKAAYAYLSKLQGANIANSIYMLASNGNLVGYGSYEFNGEIDSELFISLNKFKIFDEEHLVGLGELDMAANIRSIVIDFICEQLLAISQMDNLSIMAPDEKWEKPMKNNGFEKNEDYFGAVYCKSFTKEKIK